MNKRGNREQRKSLYQATLSAARHNPTVKALHRRLKEQGKPDEVARIAATRKLLLFAAKAELRSNSQAPRFNEEPIYTNPENHLENQT